MNDQNGHDIEALQVGMSASFAKTVAETDPVGLAGVSGDNPADRTNEVFARTAPFGGRIAHGFLRASVISAAVANHLPAPGTVYLGLQLRFSAPVRPGGTGHATVTVKSGDLIKARVVRDRVSTVDGLVGIDGEAAVTINPSARRRAQAIGA